MAGLARLLAAPIGAAPRLWTAWSGASSRSPAYQRRRDPFEGRVSDPDRLHGAWTMAPDSRALARLASPAMPGLNRCECGFTEWSQRYVVALDDGGCCRRSVAAAIPAPSATLVGSRLGHRRAHGLGRRCGLAGHGRRWPAVTNARQSGSAPRNCARYCGPGSPSSWQAPSRPVCCRNRRCSSLVVVATPLARGPEPGHPLRRPKGLAPPTAPADSTFVMSWSSAAPPPPAAA